MIAPTRRPAAALIILALVGAAHAAAQPTPASQPPTDDKPKPPAAAPSPAPAPQPPDSGELPGLDDLLGTRPDKAAPTEGDASKADLKRRLDAKELGDEFHQAVALMGDAAGRLTRTKDAGATTQRIQEDIVRKLDLLIEQLEQQSQSSQSKPSASSGQDQPQDGSRQQQRRGDRKEAGKGENNSEMDPPARQDGTLGPELDSARAAWGALPERVRKMLLQGSSDKFSESYKKLTAAYYRKLAEEGKK